MFVNSYCDARIVVVVDGFRADVELFGVIDEVIVGYCDTIRSIEQCKEMSARLIIVVAEKLLVRSYTGGVFMDDGCDPVVVCCEFQDLGCFYSRR
jgi:hypothetical protein